MIAFILPFFLSLDPFVKKLTVNGIIGNTQGVSRANNPPTKPKANTVQKPFPFVSSALNSHTTAGLSKTRLAFLNFSVLTKLSIPFFPTV